MQIRTKIKQQAVIEILKKNGGDVKSACKDVNVGRTQFYDWIKKYPDFNTDVENIYTNIKKYTTTKLYGEALKNNPKALEKLNNM